MSLKTMTSEWFEEMFTFELSTVAHHSPVETAEAVADLRKEVREQIKENDRLQAELQGIGVERYYALQAKCNELQRERDEYKQVAQNYCDEIVEVKQKLLNLNRGLTKEQEEHEQTITMGKANVAVLLSERDEARKENKRLRAIDERESLITINVHHENKKLRQANAALLEGMRWYSKNLLSAYEAKLARKLLAVYDTTQPTTVCKTCHDVGDVTLTANRQPDYYENAPCPDCDTTQSEGGNEQK